MKKKRYSHRRAITRWINTRACKKAFTLEMNTILALKQEFSTFKGWLIHKNGSLFSPEISQGNSRLLFRKNSLNRFTLSKCGMRRRLIFLSVVLFFKTQIETLIQRAGHPDWLEASLCRGSWAQCCCTSSPFCWHRAACWTTPPPRPESGSSISKWFVLYSALLFPQASTFVTGSDESRRLYVHWPNCAVHCLLGVVPICKRCPNNEVGIKIWPCKCLPVTAVQLTLKWFHLVGSRFFIISIWSCLLASPLIQKVNWLHTRKETFNTSMVWSPNVIVQILFWNSSERRIYSLGVCLTSWREEKCLD